MASGGPNGSLFEAIRANAPEIASGSRPLLSNAERHRAVAVEPTGQFDAPQKPKMKAWVVLLCGVVLALYFLGGSFSSRKPRMLLGQMGAHLRHYRDTRVHSTEPHSRKGTTGLTMEHGDPALSQFGEQRLLGAKRKESDAPVYFSETTLRDVDDILSEDDRLCSDAARMKHYDPNSCLGAPYLYLTLHGGPDGIRNVCKYSRDGCALGAALMPSSLHSLRSLRGMLHHQDTMFLAEAWRKDSKLLRYSRCNPSLGHRRELLQVLVDSSEQEDPGMLHPYGFAKPAAGEFLYVSAQGTNSVLRFNHLDGSPGPVPRALAQRRVVEGFNDDDDDDERSSLLGETKGGDVQQPRKDSLMESSGHKLDRYYDGTFVDLGNDEVRGITFDARGLLYVANKQKGVLVFDREGFLIGELPLNVPNPISVYYCKGRDSVWVGSADNHTLHEYDSTTWESMQNISHHELKHPAGVVSYGDALYVVSQEKDQLLKFSMVSGQLEDVVLPWLPDDGERVSLSPC